MRKIGEVMRVLLIGLWITLVVLVDRTVAQAIPNFFVEATIDNQNPFVGQQIIYSFRLYIRSGYTNRGSIVKPDYAGFWRQDYSQIVESTEIHNNEVYRVRESRTILYPTQPGLITIEPTTFVIPRDAFSPGEVQFTDAIDVNVMPLPDSEEIKGFTGLVGQLELIQTLDRQATNLGEPIQLQLTIRGNGNIEQVPIPILVPMAEWRSYANTSDYVATEADGRILGEKTFEWLLTPRQVGQYRIPEILLSYFDLNSLEYQRVNLTPIVIDVQGDADAASLPANRVSDDNTPMLRPIPAILLIGSGSSLLVNIIFASLWIMPIFATIVVWQQIRRRRFRRLNRAYYRYVEALEHAQQVLSTLHKHPNSNAFRLIQSAIMHYFADKLDRTASSLHYTAIAGAMEQRVIDAELVRELLECLHEADQVLYTPGAQSDVDKLAARASRLLSTVDASWDD